MKRTLPEPKKKLTGRDILAMSSEDIKRLPLTVHNYEAMVEFYKLKDELKAELAEVNAKLAKANAKIAEIKKKTAKALELAHAPSGIMRQLEKLEAAGNSAETIAFYRKHRDVLEKPLSARRR